MEKPKILGQDSLKTMTLCDWIANLAIFHLDKPVTKTKIASKKKIITPLSWNYHSKRAESPSSRSA